MSVPCRVEFIRPLAVGDYLYQDRTGMVGRMNSTLQWGSVSIDLEVKKPGQRNAVTGPLVSGVVVVCQRAPNTTIVLPLADI